MVKIITDSTSDISEKRRKELGIEIIPLTVIFGDKGFKDGIELTIPEFYKKLATADKLPTTAQLTPGELEDAFALHVKNGDDVVGIFLSSHMSGTYQSAVTARENTNPDRVFVIDSKNVTLSLALLVEAAVKMRDGGRSAAQIEREAESLSKRLRLFAAVDTLKYLKMGGRLSGTAAFVGGFLGITPIISVIGGEVKAIGKTRGRRAAMEYIQKEVENAPPDTAYPIFFGHSNSPNAAAEFMGFMRENAGMDTRDSQVSEIGCIVGAHVGPGAFGIAYFEKE